MNGIREDLIKEFQSKAGSLSIQNKAQGTWKRLSPMLTQDERNSLLAAWSHSRMGDGRNAIDAVCKKLLSQSLEHNT